MNWHPRESDLALARTGDLAGWKKYLVERHVRRCGVCSQRADSYADLSVELRDLGQQLEVPQFLAARIVAAASALDAQPRWKPAAAAALLALVVLALLVVGQNTPLPRGLDYQASATPEAVVGEVVGPHGRQRVVFYTGTRRGRVEVSAGGGGIGISHADPDTGAVTITRISLAE